jgi:RNA polymerase sigma-70 factor (ECF subfamily)
VPATKLRRSARIRQPPEPTPLAVPLSDAVLSERLAQGDRWAQEAMFRKYVREIWGLALRLMGNRVDAEEVVQDTFAEALHDTQQARERRMLRSWLVGVAVHHARRKLQRRRLLRLFGFERGERTHRLDEQLARSLDAGFASDLHKLGELLERMPPRRRIAWCLRYMEGCSVDEVASYCACSLALAGRELDAAQAIVRIYLDIREPSDV